MTASERETSVLPGVQVVVVPSALMVSTPGAKVTVPDFLGV